jgi:small subunit ribosomal protein S14
MAKKSLIAREVKRKKLVGKYSKLRNEIKTQIAKIASNDGVNEEVWGLQQRLQALPVNSASIRMQKRCRCCGRPRAVYKKFGLCRICLRKAVMRGDVPGATKASW